MIIKSISYGDGSIFVIDIHGRIWEYYDDKLELVSEESQFVKISCSYWRVFVLDSDGVIWTWENCGKDFAYPQMIPSKNKFNNIICGWNRLFAFLNDGSVFAYGSERCGELGVGSNINGKLSTFTPLDTKIKFEKLTILKNKTFGIAINGQAYVWGKYHHEIYYSPTLLKLYEDIRFKSIHGSNKHIFGLATDGTVYIFNKNYVMSYRILFKVKEFAYDVKNGHCILIDYNNEIWVYNDWNNFSTEKINTKCKTIISELSCCVMIKNDGNVYTFGRGNEYIYVSNVDNPTKTDFILDIQDDNEIRFRNKLKCSHLQNDTCFDFF